MVHDLRRKVEQVFDSTSRGPASGGSTNVLLFVLAALTILLLGFLTAWAFLRRRGRQAPSSPVFYITAVHMPSGTGHQQIELVQWQNPQTLEAAQSTREASGDWIHAGGDIRVRDHLGNEARVAVVDGDPPHIRSYSDGAWTDLLLLVPRY